MRTTTIVDLKEGNFEVACTYKANGFVYNAFAFEVKLSATANIDEILSCEGYTVANKTFSQTCFGTAKDRNDIVVVAYTGEILR